MSRKVCSNCKNEYWVNRNVDEEYVCTKCGYVEEDRMIGQLSGRINVVDE